MTVELRKVFSPSAQFANSHFSKARWLSMLSWMRPVIAQYVGHISKYLCLAGLLNGTSVGCVTGWGMGPTHERKRWEDGRQVSWVARVVSVDWNFPFNDRVKLFLIWMACYCPVILGWPPKIPVFRWHGKHKEVEKHCPCVDRLLPFPVYLGLTKLASPNVPTTKSFWTNFNPVFLPLLL